MIEKDKVVDNISSIFNRYSGKDKLEEEIDRLQSHLVEMEIDIKTYRTKMEKSETSEKKAIAAKQEAEEKLNAVEVRLRTLEHELDKQRRDEPAEMSYSRIDHFNKQRVEEFLSSLSSLKYPEESLLTVHLAAGESLENIMDSESLRDRIDGETLALTGKLDTSTGYVLFYSPDNLINEVLVPPLPLKTSSWNYGTSFGTSGLLTLLNEDATICVLATHAGESFVGMSLDSGDFESFRMIKTSVKAKHAKGGFSQRRFERLRDEDIAHHIEKTKMALNEIFAEFKGNVDHLIMTGDLQLAKEISKDIPLDVERVFSSSDIRIEKHNISGILKQLMVCRRYRL